MVTTEVKHGGPRGGQVRTLKYTLVASALHKLNTFSKCENKQFIFWITDFGQSYQVLKNMNCHSISRYKFIVPPDNLSGYPLCPRYFKVCRFCRCLYMLIHSHVSSPSATTLFNQHSQLAIFQWENSWQCDFIVFADSVNQLRCGICFCFARKIFA